MASPNREAIESYEARIVAYELGRESRADRMRSPPTVRSAAPGIRRVHEVHRDPALRAHPRPTAIRLRARRIVVLTSLILLVDLVVSFWGAMAGPSNTSFGVRAVEWLRDNGAAGAGVGRREHLLLAELARDRRPAAQAAPAGRDRRAGSGRELRAGADCPGDHVPRSRARGSGAEPGRWSPAPRPSWSPPSAPTRTTRSWSPASRGSTTHGRGSRSTPGRYEPPNDGSQPAEVPPQLALEPARHVQQRLQARGLRRRLLLPGSRCTRR